METPIEKKIGYMCFIDYNWELSHTNVHVYESVKALQEARNCGPYCGIIEVEVSFKKFMIEPTGEEI